VYFDRIEYDSTRLLTGKLNHIIKTYSCQELEGKMVFTLEFCNGGVFFVAYIYLTSILGFKKLFKK
jgi:hypothetical protein